ncbi:MAG: universal stress protein [Hydrococcus sp. SU_1_0]|nr:universal stress protein [Hydrococcus sp. SU_1_0]
MFNKILVAIDRSPVNKQVFEQGLALAKADQAHLILLHVFSTEEADLPQISPYLVQHQERCLHDEPPIMQLGNEAYDLERSDVKQQGIKLLRSFAERAMYANSSANSAIATGIATEFSQITGHPSSTICEFAKSCQADLIVMGGRGYSGLKDIFLGNVSNYVVHHAPCSVLLVQPSMP